MSAGEYWRRKYDELAGRDIPDWQKSYWWDRRTFKAQYDAVLGCVDRYARGRRLTIGDVGCGPGAYLPALLERGHRVIGIDYIRPNLDSASIKTVNAPGALLCQSDAEHLPLREGALDAVLALGLLGTVDDVPGVLAAIVRSLKSGGMAVLTFHRRHRVWELPFLPIHHLYFLGHLPASHKCCYPVAALKARGFLAPRSGDEPRHCINRFEARCILAYLRDKGMRIKRYSLVNRFPYPTMLFNSYMALVAAERK